MKTPDNTIIWTAGQLLKWGADYLASHNLPDARIEAEYLLTNAMKYSKKDLLLNPDKVLSADEIIRFSDFIYRRGRREPAHYITGEVEFRGGLFKVNRMVLIPRPETELLVEEAIRSVEKNERFMSYRVTKGEENNPPYPPFLKEGKGGFEVFSKEVTVLDLCTGSGCIAVSIAKELTLDRVYAIDVSEGALRIAQENAKRIGVWDKITFLSGDLFNALEGIGLEGAIDLIVSNPPYVSRAEMNTLQPEIMDYEPALALYGGEDGLDFYSRIIHDSPRYLSPEGALIMELGYGKAEGVRHLLEEEKVFAGIEIIKDLAGIDRVIKATASKGER